MALATQYLLDRSATSRATSDAVATRLRQIPPLRLMTCVMSRLEVLYSTRNCAQWHEVETELAALQNIDITPAIEARAIEVQGVLWCSGRLRAVGIADLLIAACAESAGATLLHYDADFDHIAEATGQPMDWVVPRGSVP